MASLDDYLPAALATLGQITIRIAPIERYEAVYNPHTHELQIDPSADIQRALADLLITIVDGQPERALVALAGGGGGAAATWRPDHDRPTLSLAPPAS